MDSLAGTVEVKLDGDAEWKKSAMGDCLFGGDSVKTGADSGLSLVLNDGGMLKFAASTISLLSGKRRKDDKTREVDGAEMTEGEIWADIATDAGAFAVTTPTGVVNVRGTEFTTRVDKDEEGKARLQVFGLSGKVEVEDKGKKKKVLLEAGKAARVVGEELSDAFEFDVAAFKDYLKSWKDLLTPGGIRDFIKAKAFDEIQKLLDSKLKGLLDKVPGGGGIKLKAPGF